MADYKLNLNIDELLQGIDTFQNVFLDLLAREIVDETQQRIEANGQKETGAMQASTYMVTPLESSYGPAVADAAGFNDKAEFGPEPAIEENQAVVGVAVNYAVFNETGHATRNGGSVAGKPFLYPSAEKATEKAAGLAAQAKAQAFGGS